MRINCINQKNLGEIILEEKVGLSSIPTQMRDRSILDGFVFNLLVVGRRGQGTKTLVNSLFASPILSDDRSNDIVTTISEIVENNIYENNNTNIKLKVSITTFHNTNYNKVYDFIDSLNEEYLQEEQLIFSNILDKRIHCCLYLIPNDIILESELECLRKLSTLTNVIPVITKADIYTAKELEEYKKSVYSKIFKTEDSINLVAEEITKMNIYRSGNYKDDNYTENNYKDDNYTENNYKDDNYTDNTTNNSHFTLFHPIMSVIASEEIYDIGGVPKRGRKYPWGFVPIDQYCDFQELRKLIIYDRFEDLIEKTNETFYSEYRDKHRMNVSDEHFFKKLQIQIEEVVYERNRIRKEQLLREEEDLDRMLKSMDFSE